MVRDNNFWWMRLDWSLTSTALIGKADRHTPVWLSLVVEPTTVVSSSKNSNTTKIKYGV